MVPIVDRELSGDYTVVAVPYVHVRTQLSSAEMIVYRLETNYAIATNNYPHKSVVWRLERRSKEASERT